MASRCCNFPLERDMYYFKISGRVLNMDHPLWGSHSPPTVLTSLELRMCDVDFSGRLIDFCFPNHGKIHTTSNFPSSPPLSVKSIPVVVQLTSRAVLISRTKILCPLNKNCLFLPPHSPWWPHRTDCLYESDYSGYLMQGESQHLSGFLPSASCPQGSSLLEPVRNFLPS